MNDPVATRQPNPEQAAVLASNHPKKIIVAGAGSGKTQTLAWQILQWIAEGINPRDMVCITFTNAAADEYRARLPGVKLGFMGTVHAYCLSIVNRYAPVLGMQRDAVAMIDEEAETRMVKECLASIKAAAKWTVAEVRRWKYSGGKVSNPAAIAAKQYRQRLRAGSLVDFDTVLVDALDILERGQVMPPAVLLVDEFQDSAPFHALIYDAIKATRKFVVGDPDQAIYAHAGGDVRNILDLADSDEWELHRLETNHRCPWLVVDAANTLILHNSARVEKTMRYPHKTPRGTVEIMEAGTPLAEAAAIAARVKKEADPKKVAVLARFNAQIPAIVAALEAEGLTVWNAGDAGENWMPVAISALNALIDPGNETAAQTWLNHAFEPAALDALRSIKTHSETLVNVAFDQLGIDIDDVGKAPAAMKLPRMAYHYIVAHWQPDLRDTLAALLSLDTSAEPDEGVHVGTVHSYKGREADTVILAGMCDEATPGSKTGDDLESERRLFYVALTRARRTLVVSHSLTYFPPFSKAAVAATRTRFFDEAFPGPLDNLLTNLDD